MKTKRLLPFLFLLLLLGGGILLLKSKSVDPELSEISDTGAVDTDYLALQDELKELKSNGGQLTFSALDDWGANVKRSEAHTAHKTELLQDLGIEAMKLWKTKFNSWMGTHMTTAPPLSEYDEVRALLGKYKLLAFHVSKFTQPSQTFACYDKCFKPGAPWNVSTKLNGLIRGQYSADKYDNFLAQLKAACNAILASPAYTNARARILAQKNCHKKVADHYTYLEENATTEQDYGKQELPPTIHARQQFQCGTVSRHISEFNYYYSQGQSSKWIKPIW